MSARKRKPPAKGAGRKRNIALNQARERKQKRTPRRVAAELAGDTSATKRPAKLKRSDGLTRKSAAAKPKRGKGSRRPVAAPAKEPRPKARGVVKKPAAAEHGGAKPKAASTRGGGARKPPKPPEVPKRGGRAEPPKRTPKRTTKAATAKPRATSSATKPAAKRTTAKPKAKAASSKPRAAAARPKSRATAAKPPQLTPAQKAAETRKRNAAAAERAERAEFRRRSEAAQRGAETRKRNAAKAAREERAERKAIREEAAPKLSQLAERVETLRGELRRLTLEGASASEILAAARALEKATRAHERARKRTPSLDELDTRPKRIKTALREMVEALEAHRRKEPGAYELFRDVKRRLHGERVANWAELCEEAAVEAGWSLGYAERFSKLS